MKSIYKKLKDHNFSILMYSSRNKKNRINHAVEEVFDKISIEEYDLSKKKNVLLTVTLGNNTEVTIDELEDIHNIIIEKTNGVNITSPIAEKNIDKDIEVQIIISNLNFDTYNTEEIYDIIKEKINGTNILTNHQEKNTDKSIEVQIIVTSLEFEADKKYLNLTKMKEAIICLEN